MTWQNTYLSQLMEQGTLLLFASGRHHLRKQHPSCMWIVWWHIHPYFLHKCKYIGSHHTELVWWIWTLLFWLAIPFVLLLLQHPHCLFVPGESLYITLTFSKYIDLYNNWIGPAAWAHGELMAACQGEEKRLRII